MRKLSKINESLWMDSIKRANTDTVRKEDGKKVKTCLGNEVILENPNCKYNTLIEELVNKDDSHALYISTVKDSYLSPEVIEKSRKFKDPYNYMIFDSNYKSDCLIVNFNTYEEDIEYMTECDEPISKKDYISICKCIASKLKEVSNYIDYIPKKYIFSISGDTNNISRYSYDYHFKLIDESDVYNWLIENDDDNYLDDFYSAILDIYPNLEYEDFFGWSYNNNGDSIGIPLNMNTILNINQYVEYTKNYFKV